MTDWSQLEEHAVRLAHLAMSEPDGAPVEHRAVIEGAHVQLRACVVATSAAGGPLAVVEVEPVPAAASSGAHGAPAVLEGLSRREVQVAMLLVDGLTNREIAERIDLSVHTVRRHVERILSKLQVRTRAAAVGRIIGGGGHVA
ncbi:MAG: helix-turn-helix transcriptional regulator [Gemmatimonadales bacterium]|nr:helix-turn-helix transcriptional regulator [Gemmatimonadales bacterium]